MTRQRLREGSIRWETNLSLESFALKLVKKSEMLSFTEKVKSINVQAPEKVKIYIDRILKKEIKYFEDKFKIKINFIADPKLIIPEYKMNLLDKNKKIINKIENINKVEILDVEIDKKIKESKNLKKGKNSKKTFSKKIKKSAEKGPEKNVEKKIKKKTPRTLWVRRKKKAA